jgi:hypothetical protein
MGIPKGAARMAVAGLVARRIKRARDVDRQNGGYPQAMASAPTSSAREQTDAGGEGGEVAAQRAGEPGPDSPLELRRQDWEATARRTLKESRTTA